MEKAPMPKWLKIVIAIVACAIVIIGYSVLSVALGFKHGGGYLVLILLFSLLGGIWRSIVGSSKEKESEIATEEEATPSETPVKADTPTIENEITPQGIASENVEKEEMVPPVNIISNEVIATTPDYHIVLKVLLIILMIVGIVVMIYQAVNDFTWENYTIGWIRLISSLIGLVGFILLYMKKLAGYIIIASVLLFSIVYSAIMHDSNLGMIVLAAVFRLVAISLFLFIRKDGVSAWSILLHRYTSTIKELKETFPVKPFLYIEKQPEVKPKESENSTSNFDNWLNS